MKLKKIISLILVFTSLNSYSLEGSKEGKSQDVNTDSLKVPFYFAIPKRSYLKTINDNDFEPIEMKNTYSEDAGLRVVRFSNITLNENLKTRIPKLTKNFRKLGKKGLLKTGDILLTVRLGWEDAVPYSRLQMGVSHSSMIYEDKGVVKHLDLPLSTYMNGEGFSGDFSSEHYTNARTFHILRPKKFTAAQQENYLRAIKLLKSNASALRAKGLLDFNEDYLKANYNNYPTKGSINTFVTTFANIILGKDTKSTDLKMYCSEVAWALHSLSNCTLEQLNANTDKSAACVKNIFNPISIVGNKSLSSGPLQILNSLNVSTQEKIDLYNTLFKEGSAEQMSTGHRALAMNKEILQLTEVVKMSQTAKLLNETTINFPRPNTQISTVEAMFNQKADLNYSPTAFLINAMLPDSDPQRAFEYVGTIITHK